MGAFLWFVSCCETRNEQRFCFCFFKRKNRLKAGLFIKVRKLQTLIFIKRPVDIPLTGEQQQEIVFKVLNYFSIGTYNKVFRFNGSFVYPSYIGVRQRFSDNFNIVLIFHKIGRASCRERV